MNKDTSEKIFISSVFSHETGVALCQLSVMDQKIKPISIWTQDQDKRDLFMMLEVVNANVCIFNGGRASNPLTPLAVAAKKKVTGNVLIVDSLNYSRGIETYKSLASGGVIQPSKATGWANVEMILNSSGNHQDSPIAMAFLQAVEEASQHIDNDIKDDGWGFTVGRRYSGAPKGWGSNLT